MSRDAYELLALGARYVFAGLMVLIALRAARLTAVDSRRAAKLRRLSPMTGLSGELVVLEGDGKAPRGMRYPVIREGMIGSARSCDVRIRHASVRRRHACFQLTEQGLSVRDHAGARLRDGDGEVVREMTLLDGDSFWVGRIHLLLVLSNATAAQSRRAPEDLFATRREEDWDGEGAACNGEDWEARAETRSRDGFDEERDWDENTPRNSTFDRTSDCNAASLRTSCQTDMRRAAERESDALCSHSFSSVHGASDNLHRTSDGYSDLRSRDTSFRASRGEASPLPGIARDSAPRGGGQRPVEPSISREDRRSHAFAPRGDGQRPAEPSISREDRCSHAFAPRGEGQRSVEPSISREDRYSHASAPRGEGLRSAEPSISREDRCSHASAPRGGMKRSSQPRVREGVRREPEPPDDLFMDDL